MGLSSTERSRKYREEVPLRQEFREIIRLFRAGFMTKSELKGFIQSVRKMKGVSSPQDLLSKIMQGNDYAKRDRATSPTKSTAKKKLKH